MIIYGLAIMPSEKAPTLGGGDKVNHMVAFFTLTLIGRAAYRRSPVWLLAGGLSLFGVLIEITQAIPVLKRDSSVWDWVADSAAILVALGLAALIEKRLPSLFKP